MKTRFIIVALAILCFSVLFAACRDENNSEWKNSLSNSQVNSSTSIPKENKEVFSFDLKESFSSREEIFEEEERLRKAFTEYINDCYDDELRAKSKELLFELGDKLDKELEKFPPSEAEILNKKEEKLDYEVNYLELSLSTLYAVWQDDPDNQEKKQYYLDEKENLAFAKKIQQQYLNGEITIDEALEKLEIKY